MILSLLLPVIPGTAIDPEEIVTDAVASPVTEEPTVAEPTPEAAPTILHEDESLRGQYEKHFLMSDGTYQAVVYNEPVHCWAEVDNTLSLQTAADGTSRYATADGLAEVSFSRSFDDQLVTVRQGDYSLAWGVQAVTGNTMPTISTATHWRRVRIWSTLSCSVG